MNQFFDFAGVAGAVVFSIALGVYLEWLGLRALMLLMPATPRVVSNIQRSAAVEHGRGAKAA